jgi:hypothetical protein
VSVGSENPPIQACGANGPAYGKPTTCSLPPGSHGLVNLSPSARYEETESMLIVSTSGQAGADAPMKTRSIVVRVSSANHATETAMNSCNLLEKLMWSS